MAILSLVRDSSILENNIVQTVASAAGTLSAIIFVLPGLVIVGWWTGFPFWTSFLVCVAGGILGVLFTIPLRRALVTTSDLPYPEGVAAAEVLKVGSGTRGETKDETGEAREGLMAVVSDRSRRRAWRSSRRRASPPRASPASSASARRRERLRHRVLARAVRRRPSRRPVGRHGDAHRPRSSPGPAPCRSSPSLQPAADGRRPRGAHRARSGGTRCASSAPARLAIAAIWTLAKLAKPVVGGLVSTIAASRATATGDERDRDMSRGWIIGLTVVCLALSAWLAVDFVVRHAARAACATTLALIAVPFVLIGGFLIAGDLRLHGRPHRRVEQPDLRRRHPRRSSVCATVLVLACPADARTRGRRSSPSRSS